jgi:hypothetical protein
VTGRLGSRELIELGLVESVHGLAKMDAIGKTSSRSSSARSGVNGPGRIGEGASQAADQ